MAQNGVESLIADDARDIVRITEYASHSIALGAGEFAASGLGRRDHFWRGIDQSDDVSAPGQPDRLVPCSPTHIQNSPRPRRQMRDELTIDEHMAQQTPHGRRVREEALG